MPTASSFCYNAFTMHTFPNDHVIILPHAEEYREAYDISLDELVLTLNEPDVHEGLSDDRYTVEKSFASHRVYVYYYRTLPLQGKQDELYAIVDFVGVSGDISR